MRATACGARIACGSLPVGRSVARPWPRRADQASAIRSQKIGPSLRSPTAKSTARAVRGASGIVTVLPPLRWISRVR